MARLSLLLMTTLMASPAFAMDPGTYRPGMAYDSIKAQNPSMCEAQCSGDAQCRGWNFVKINPNIEAGVCEFNAKTAAPVPSTYSVSGENISAPRSATIIPGRSNTVRVGNVNAQPARRTSPTRRIVREAVPQKINPRATAYRKPQAPTPRNMQNMSLTEQQNLHRRNAAPQAMRQPAPQARPQFQHNLDSRGIIPHQSRPQNSGPQNSGPQNSGPQNSAPQRTAPHAARRAVTPAKRRHIGSGDPRLQQRLMQQRQHQQRQTPTGQASQQQQQHMQRPQAQRPAPQGYPQQAQAPQRPTTQRQRPNVNIPAEMSPQRPMTAAQAQQSLFGSLHDDVKVPRPINPAALAANPDAPIPTVSNVPVAPVQMEPLPRATRQGPPAAPNTRGLAGGGN